MCVCVSDADVEVEGVPVAPLDVRCHDANKDYVVVTWKQPAVEGSSSVLGYFIDRSVRVQVHLREMSRTRRLPKYTLTQRLGVGGGGGTRLLSWRKRCAVGTFCRKNKRQVECYLLYVPNP